jgi:ABC-type spermidine/putrescine transport systems, ATPase components
VLRMIAGLESCTGGQILMDGRDVTTLGPTERNVSMMFQSYALFPHMNVVENVMYGLRMSGQGKDEARQRAVEALQGVGLVGYDERMPSELSGGQQQRVAWRARWCWNRACCSLTSRFPILTPVCGAKCARKSAPCSSG